MAIHNSGQRRRRVVKNELVQMHERDESAPVSLNRPKRSRKKTVEDQDTRVYTSSANRRHLKKTTDLFPKRFISCALVVLVLVAGIGLLNLLCNYSAQIGTVVGDQGLQAISLTEQGSLASWFKSFLLIMTGLASLQIYALRQHRCDDYRGTYRLWLWIAALLFLASINCVVDVASIARNVAASVLGMEPAKGVWTILAIKLVALTALVIRGLIEVRQCRSAFALVCLVWVAWTTAAVLQLPVVRESTVVNFEVSYGNLLLFGTLGLFLSALFYARFVYLMAQGLIVPVVNRQAVALDATENVGATAGNIVDEVSEATDAGLSTAQREKTLEREKALDKERAATPKSTRKSTTKKKAKGAKRPPVPRPSRKVPEPEQSLELPMKTRDEIREDQEDQQILKMSSGKKGKMSKAERKRLQKQSRKRRAA